MRIIEFLVLLSVAALLGCQSSNTVIDFGNLSTVTPASSVAPVKIGDRFNVGDILIEGRSGVQFGDHGGSVNLIIDGTHYVADNFAGISHPGLTVTPTMPHGSVAMAGTITTLYYSFPCPPFFPTYKFTAVVGGGQELGIDDVEFEQ